MFKIITLTLVLTAATSGFSWNMESKYEPVPGKTIKRTVLKFRGEGLEGEYRPFKAPYLMNVREHLKLESGENVFITVWSLGAQSVIYRIFNPVMNITTPICELWSISDEIRYRIKEGKLEFKVLKSLEPSPVWEWKACD